MAVYVDGELAGVETSQKFRYDEHGRLIKAIRTPDTDAFPSQVVSYELGDPVSRISIHKRSKTSGEPDLYSVNCMDGKGRAYQSRVQLAPGQFQVNGFAVFNSQGQPVRQYQPYLATTDACDASEAAVPAGTLYTQYVYDAEDRVKSVTYEDGTQSRSVYEPLATRQYAEDDNDAKNANHDTPMVTRTDGLGRTVAIDRYLTPTTKGTTALGYDDLGRLVTVTDDKGYKRTQEYDGMDRVTRVVDPNSGELVFTYDAIGNLLTRKDAVTTEAYGYDGMNRQTTAWDAANEATTKSTMTYDRVKDCADCTTTSGRLAQMQYPLGADAVGDAVGLDQLGYDARGQLIFRSQRLEGHSFVTRLEYDDANRMVKKTLPDGSTEQTTFDAASRATAIAGVITAVSYDGRGLETSITHANGVVDARTYDVRMRTTSLRTTGGGKVLFGLDLQRDVDGSLLSLTDKADAVAGRPMYGTQITSDAWHRTLTANLGTSAGTSELMTNSYDTIDNVLAITSSLGATSAANVGAASYDATHPNMLSSADGQAYSYDAAGRMTARGDAKFTRNWFGRIGRVQRAGMADEVSIYAGESARVMKLSEGGATYYVDPSFEVRDGISIAYTRLGGRTARRMSDAMATQVLSDLAPATAAGTVLTPGGDKHITVADAWLAQAASAGLVTFASGTMPSPVTRLLRASARRALLDDGEAVVHLHADQLGSLVLATGATGAVLAQRSFYPTGLERESTAFVDTYGFTGQEMELASGLLHFGFRDLDPWTGRWDASDPSFAVLDDENAGAMGEATTGYAYVANDTMDHVDPTGLGIGKAFRSLGRKMARSGMLGKGMQTKYKAKRAAKHAAKAHAQMMAALLVAERAARIQAADLDLIRSDPVTKVGLREQLAREFSTENLDFLDAIDRLPPPGDAQEFSALVTLHNTFVRDEVARQVNLPGTIQKPLWEVDLRGAGGTAAYRALLGNARANVHNLIENDSLPRFKKHLRENP
jgi:RHS repeat-associated protein